MRRPVQLLVLGGAVAFMTGCASYGDFVNSYAPEKSGGATAQLNERKSGRKYPCCPKPAPITEIYMVMPEEGGKAGTVDVTFKSGEALQLHGAYSAMSLAGEANDAYVADEKQLKKLFGDAVSAIPKAPLSVTLFFDFGKVEIAPASKADVERIIKDFRQRPAPEVIIVGHADTVGAATGNDKLSARRAEKVQQELIKLGMSAESIRIAGKGESEPLIPTPDNVKEPKNRRVEVHVR